MIQGKILAEDQTEDDDRNREEYYDIGLQTIEGIEGHAYGIMQELHDLEKLLESLGATVEKEEKEFLKIEKEEFNEETRELTNKLLSSWHKKMYRQFTYKALIMLIHLSFESGIVRLYDFLTAEGRISVTPVKKLRDIIKALKFIDTAIDIRLFDKVRAFNFIRNHIAHNNGHYNEKSKDYEAFEIFARTRNDISVKKLASAKGKFTHCIQIKKSTLIKEYLIVIKQVFTCLIRGSRKLKYKPKTQ